MKRQQQPPDCRNADLEAQLKCLWRDTQSWATETVVFGSGPEETGSVSRFITKNCHLHLRHSMWQSRSSISIKVSPAALVSVCHHRHLLVLSQVWSLKLEQEVEKNKALTEALQILAAEHQELKESVRSSRRSSAPSTLTEEDFYDALSGQPPGHPTLFRPVLEIFSSGKGR